MRDRRQSSNDSSTSSGSSTHRGRLVFSVLAALAHSNAMSAPVPTAEHWLGYGPMVPPPRADVNAALAASAAALRAQDADAECCAECRAQLRGRGSSAKGRSAPDDDPSRCARCAAGAQAAGCFPVLRRRRRVSPKPALS